MRLRDGGCLVVFVGPLARLQVLFGLFLGRLHVGFYGFGVEIWIDTVDSPAQGLGVGAGQLGLQLIKWNAKLCET